jgi:urate oxidase
VDRGDAVHRLTELSVDIRLDGDFDRAYTQADNSQVIPTDTIKNTIYAIAQGMDVRPIERFAWQLGVHFVERFAHVEVANVRVTERPWERAKIDGETHPHAFVGVSSERGFCEAVVTRDPETVESWEQMQCGLEGLTVLKTTESGFANYLRDEYTTLQETNDRVFATTIQAVWNYDAPPTDWIGNRVAIRETLIENFAQGYSPSVQATLFKMGSAVLDTLPEVERIELFMPNQHRLLVDLAALGLPNPNVLFVPTDEPYGSIRATVARRQPREVP